MNRLMLAFYAKEVLKGFEGVVMAMLIKEEYGDGYKLLFSAKTLDEVSPFEATLEVVKYIKEHNEDLLKEIESILVIHSEDESVCKVKELMWERSEHYFIEEGKELELFGVTIEDGIVLKVDKNVPVDRSILGEVKWLTKEKKELLRSLCGSANSRIDLNKMREEFKYGKENE